MAKNKAKKNHSLGTQRQRQRRELFVDNDSPHSPNPFRVIYSRRT